MNAIIQHSVLIVSGTQKGASYITELLSPREFAPITTALSGGDARRLLLQRSYDLVIINAPLTDEFGHELAEYTTDKFISGVMIIVKAELNGAKAAVAPHVLSGTAPAHRHAEPLAALRP